VKKTVGKSKGNSFEREVGRILSLWWTEDARDDIFYRSHSSGGRFTVRKKSGKDTAFQGGDINFSDPIGKPLIENWNIECKTGYARRTKNNLINWDVLNLIDSQQNEPILIKMWNQCKKDAELTNREAILIFRRNRKKPCIMFSVKYMNYLFGIFGMHKTYAVIIVTPTESCVIFNIKDFFEWIPNIRLAMKIGLNTSRYSI